MGPAAIPSFPGRALLCLAILVGATAVHAGDAFEQAVEAFEAGDYQTAAHQFGLLAADGHASAQFNLGNMYRQGQGVDRDPGLAARWFRAAAVRGHAGAQNALGALYAMGQGVEQSDLEAYAWFSIAAAQGNPVAQKNVERANSLIAEDGRVMAERMAAQYFQMYVAPFREPPPQ